VVAFPEEKHDGGGATEDAFARRRLAYLIRRVVCAPLLVPFKVSIRAMRERTTAPMSQISYQVMQWMLGRF
jgi:hypothetical protein